MLQSVLYHSWVHLIQLRVAHMLLQEVHHGARGQLRDAARSELGHPEGGRVRALHRMQASQG